MDIPPITRLRTLTVELSSLALVIGGTLKVAPN